MGRYPWCMLLHLDRGELAGYSAAAIVVRGKELQAGEPASRARALFTRDPVRVVPVLDGARYVGAVDRETLAHATADDVPVGELAQQIVPTVTASASAEKALAVLDADGGSRLVVLALDGTTYAGLVCLRGDRRRLCLEGDRLEREAPLIARSA